MISIISPTGKGLRIDAAGDGSFRASRGSRVHFGYDFLCEEGQEVFMPSDGLLKRVAFPYADDTSWTGVEITGDGFTIKMFYLSPIIGLVGRNLSQGEVIGYAQGISRRYPRWAGVMNDHVHLQLYLHEENFAIGKNGEVFINPLIFQEV
jgi:hypothetical protein